MTIAFLQRFINPRRDGIGPVFVAGLFFAAGLLGFHALLVLAPARIGEHTGQVFHVWFSVFNLFATMLFWGVMADRFSLEQSKRLFGAIAVGGTLGAIFGPWLAGLLARPLGTPALLPVRAVLATARSPLPARALPAPLRPPAVSACRTPP